MESFISAESGGFGVSLATACGTASSSSVSVSRLWSVFLDFEVASRTITYWVWAWR
ncbi:hypothetical protein [Haladaptatus sp. DFWS20]|uniref:hypothetical protein n=1 Tax=Haladaptatus sp. DFWS20 TaxID=3403467 RepID=UPI003EC127CC